MVNEDKLRIFMIAYEPHLTQTVLRYPEEYPWSVADVRIVVARMRKAIETGTFNKDGYAFRATCEELGIPWTYEAISKYLERKA